LVDFVAALEKGLAGEQLAEYAAYAPEVDFTTVFWGAEQEFGGAVPESDDEGCEVLGWGIADVAGHAEVGYFKETAVGEEEVGGFEVAVENVVGVEVRDARGELQEEGLDFGGKEGGRHGVEDGFEIVFEEF